jgi:hypothetical protein
MFTSPLTKKTRGIVPLTFAVPSIVSELTMNTRIPPTTALGIAVHDAPKQSQLPPLHAPPVDVLMVELPEKVTAGPVSVMSR